MTCHHYSALFHEVSIMYCTVLYCTVLYCTVLYSTLTLYVLSSFSWTRNGTHFDVEKDSKVLMKPSSGTLVIDISGEKAEAYEGIYQCTARNEHGTAVSNNIFIRQSSKNRYFQLLLSLSLP